MLTFPLHSTSQLHHNLPAVEPTPPLQLAPPKARHDYHKLILEAKRRQSGEGVVRETPLDSAAILSKALNNEIWLKREDRQKVFSFKIRGAYNRMALLAEANPQALCDGELRVITCSAGTWIG